MSSGQVRKKSRGESKSIGLKGLAEYLGLAPATVSLVMNGSAVADTISPQTKDLIFEAARKLHYKPNFFARSLRTGRSFTIGVMVPEVSEGYNATVLSGIEDYLLQEGYFYFVASHRFRRDLIDEYPQMFLQRSVDGLILVTTPWRRELPIPVATVSSHDEVKGVTNIVLDHRRAAEVALRHLVELGHRKIAVIKGQDFVPDTEVRWNAVASVARELGVPISPRLTVQIERNSPSPEQGYRVMQELLASRERFTALFAFNDISALGAMRAIDEFGWRVPRDVSVVGFDNIETAAYHIPGLTTVHQPLQKMGRMAAENVLRRLAQPNRERSAIASTIIVEPELIVRGTTAAVPSSRTRKERAVQSS
ncbi:MAG TPA: LacI family DNA-binding transcriptional regulator [Terriglobales bacterium]|nr:LacI family DNA-binding transcriptional regulator [Terriglobales bacterium]